VYFRETALSGVLTIEPERHADHRGWFARTYCRREFAAHGIDFDPVQESLSLNTRRGTRRGLHYQAAPASEPKLVRCTNGAVFDVVVDVRLGSQSFGRWISVELSSENGTAVFIPPGFAHGFQTLVDETQLLYLMAAYYDEDAQRGVRNDDPDLAISWPDVAELVISERDLAMPPLRDLL
jgi:dTDP-4-dehydrorhamnose 3,5-epimerase